VLAAREAHEIVFLRFAFVEVTIPEVPEVLCAIGDIIRVEEEAHSGKDPPEMIHGPNIPGDRDRGVFMRQLDIISPADVNTHTPGDLLHGYPKRSRMENRHSLKYLSLCQ